MRGTPTLCVLRQTPLQATVDDVGILIKDKDGEEASTFAGLFRRAISRNVPKGTLVLPIPAKRQKQRNDDTVHNYETVQKDHTVTLYCESNDLAPLSEREYMLLAGIENVETRYKTFISPDKFEWGNKLRSGDSVDISLPGPFNAAPSKTVSSVVRYVGPVEGLPGDNFGVEIKVYVLSIE